MATHSSVLAWRIPGTAAWWAAIYGVAQSQTRLKRLSSSSRTNTIHGILEARILEWVAFPFSRGSSQSKDQTCISCIAGRSFTAEPLGKPIRLCMLLLLLSCFSRVRLCATP